MRIMMIAAMALAAPLAACGMSGGGAVETPSAAPSVLKEVKDGAEIAYTAASRLGFALAKSGVIDREKFKALDRKAYAALRLVRVAYYARDPGGFDRALAETYAAIAEIRDLVK